MKKEILLTSPLKTERDRQGVMLFWLVAILSFGTCIVMWVMQNPIATWTTGIIGVISTVLSLTKSAGKTTLSIVKIEENQIVLEVINSDFTRRIKEPIRLDYYCYKINQNQSTIPMVSVLVYVEDRCKLVLSERFAPFDSLPDWNWIDSPNFSRIETDFIFHTVGYNNRLCERVVQVLETRQRIPKTDQKMRNMLKGI